MEPAERTVLHVLPHPGGGGERYVDLLEPMEGYRFSRLYLASSPEPSPVRLARSVFSAVRAARGYDLLHVHGEVAAGLCLPALATRRSIVTLHGLHLVRRLSGASRQAAVLNLRAVLRAASRTICVSVTELDELVRIVGRKAARPAVVVRNGVPIPPPRNEAERLAVREELGIAQDDVVGIWVGSLDERKDPLTAVRTANSAGVTLLLVGDGPLRNEVEREAGAHVRVLGHQSDVPRLLGAADFYLSTSSREGLSLSLLEAMTEGLVPVVADIPENGEAVGTQGVFFGLGDVEGAADALRRISSDAETRHRRAAAARDRALSSFTAQAMVDATGELYDDLVRARSA